MKTETHVVKNQAASQTARRGPVVYKLMEPVSWGTETIDELTFQPPKGKHIKGISREPTLGEILGIASKLTGVSTAIFDEMSSQDILEVSRIVGEAL